MGAGSVDAPAILSSVVGRQLSVTMRSLGGSGDGDDAAMVQPVVIRAQQHQVVQLGGPAVFPVHDVMGVQTAGGPATRHRARGVAVLQRTAQPAADQPRRPPRPDRLPVAFEPHLTGGITGQVLAISIGEQRTQMQRAIRSLTSTCTTTVVCCPCGRRAASASQPGVDQTHETPSTLLGNGGR